MPRPPDDDTLDQRVAQLEKKLERLQKAMDDQSDRKPGSKGNDSRTDPDATDDYIITTAIELLETNIRALRILQEEIRRRDHDDLTHSMSARTMDRAATLSRTTADRLDSVLSDPQSDEFPREPEARAILQDAYDLRNEIRHMLAPGSVDFLDDADRESETGSKPVTEGASNELDIDIDAELRTIRAELFDQVDDENSNTTDLPTTEDDDEKSDTGENESTNTRQRSD